MVPFQVPFDTIAVTLILVAFMGCESVTGPSNLGGVDTAEIEGAIVLKNGIEILEIKSNSVKGKIVVERGQNGDVYSVEFRDVNEEVIELDDKAFELYCNFEDMNCAGIERDEQLDKYQFYLSGYQKGETKLNFVLNKNDIQHYKTPAIAMKVQ